MGGRLSNSSPAVRVTRSMHCCAGNVTFTRRHVEMAGTDGSLLCELCATVPTGFESGAAAEVSEVLGRTASVQRGKVSFGLAAVEELHKVCII